MRNFHEVLKSEKTLAPISPILRNWARWLQQQTITLIQEIKKNKKCQLQKQKIDTTEEKCIGIKVKKRLNLEIKWVQSLQKRAYK